MVPNWMGVTDAALDKAKAIAGRGYAVLLAVFLWTLLDGLSHGQRNGWASNSILTSFIVAAVSGAAFLAWELHTPSPMLELHLFAKRSFAGAAIVSFIFGAGIFGSTYLIPLFVQTVQGYTPTRAGLLLMPSGLVMGVMFPIAGRLIDRAPAYATFNLLRWFSLSSFMAIAVVAVVSMLVFES